MAEPQLKKKVTLIGRLDTPIILSKPLVKKGACWIKVIGDRNGEKKPLLTSFSKLVKGESRAPTVLHAYRGFVQVSCVGYNTEKLLTKISSFMTNRFLGSYSSEGFGRVKWLECKIESFIHTKANQRKEFKIRKGLGVNYPEKLLKLLKVLMLHDFVHTERHPSKIYQELQIEDEEIRTACVNHHNGAEHTNALLPILQYYDRLASSISRKKRFKVPSRYNRENGEIDFKLLKQDLEQVQHSPYRLYNYIYHSKELERIVESMDYGISSLRNHLLLMVNLAINDYYKKRLKISKGTISLSASKREELDTAMDAEMHSSLTMSNADSERATTSKKRRLGT